MEKHLYVLHVEKPFSESELREVEAEICRLFDCTEIKVSGRKQFTLYSPLGPNKLEGTVRQLSTKFRAQFRAGGKVE